MMPIVVIPVVFIAIYVFFRLGLSIKPKPFPVYTAHTPRTETVTLPKGLPRPVERFYRSVYGDSIPLIRSVIMTGKAVIKPVMNIPLPARFVFVHNAGYDYRHYFEAAFFGLPFLKVNEGIIDGKSFFESPMGSYTDDPNTNQGANLALWAEASLFPAVFLTDTRVRWSPIDEASALLTVPYGKITETFVVRFSPESGMIDMMEVMRFRSPGDKKKILWIPITEKGKPLPGSPISSVGSALWLDQGKPWATFTVEDIAYNADVGSYIRKKGFWDGRDGLKF